MFIDKLRKAEHTSESRIVCSTVMSTFNQIQELHNEKCPFLDALSFENIFSKSN